MKLSLRRFKFVAVALVILHVFPCFLESRSSAPFQVQPNVTKLITDGKALYGQGEYEKAINLFWEALSLTQSRELRSQILFNLALAYYSLGDEVNCRSNLGKLFEIQPDLQIEGQELPSGFVQAVQAEKAKLKKPEVRSEKPQPAKAIKTKKFPWLLVLIPVAVAAVVIYLLASKKKPSAPTAEVSVTFSPNPAYYSVAKKNWEFDIILKETNGVGVRINKLLFNYGDTWDDFSAYIEAWFGTRIEANGTATFHYEVGDTHSRGENDIFKIVCTDDNGHSDLAFESTIMLR
jgi:tetratricopeptide (TPR) repeat protein